MRHELRIGLRGKIIGLFFVCFSLMTMIAVTLLQSNLHQSFKAIESEEALKQINQVANNFTNEFERLNQINSDWSNWNDMYNFVQHPTSAFAQYQLNAQAMRTVGLKFITVVNARNQTIFFDAANLNSGKSENAHAFEQVIEHVKQRILQPIANSNTNCGLDNSDAGAVIVCWQAIHNTDHSGEFIGTLIVGEMLEGAALQRIHAQSSINFNLLPVGHISTYTPNIANSPLDSKTIQFESEQSNILNAQLSSIAGRPIFNLQVHFSQSVSQRGEAITWKVIWVLMLVAALTGITLLISLHYLLIRRLRKLDMDLNNIWRNGRWAERLPISQKRDELYYLARTINRMLALIRKQIIVLESLAHTDSLTNIANRRAFDQRLALEIAQHQRTQNPLALVLIDVDYFKRYNDYYGHPAGDKVLIAIARLLSEVASRPTDLAARIGGEEFAIILPNTTLDGSRHVAENIRQKLAALHLEHADSPLTEFITLSIGITEAVNTDDPSALIQRADKATYEAKQVGRNTVCSLP